MDDEPARKRLRVCSNHARCGRLANYPYDTCCRPCASKRTWIDGLTGQRRRLTLCILGPILTCLFWSCRYQPHLKRIPLSMRALTLGINMIVLLQAAKVCSSVLLLVSFTAFATLFAQLDDLYTGKKTHVTCRVSLIPLSLAISVLSGTLAWASNLRHLHGGWIQKYL